MGLITNTLDSINEEQTDYLEKFVVVWERYEKWIISKLPANIEVTLSGGNLRNEWIIQKNSIWLVRYNWAIANDKKRLTRDQFHCRLTPVMLPEYYRAIQEDVKSSDTFSRTPEGKVLPPRTNNLIIALKEKNIWKLTSSYSTTDPLPL